MSAAKQAGRFIVVDGRRWRATDPSIPEPLRVQLVKQLMSARRAVRAAESDPVELSVARRRVHDAKVALGERGESWWLPPTVDGGRQRILATFRTMLGSRTPPATLCPSEIARVVGGDTWRHRMAEVRAVGRELHVTGDLVVVQRGCEVDDPADTTGPIRYRRAGAVDPPG